MKYCKDCKYAKASLDVPFMRCTHRDMPSWFNVYISDSREACDMFEPYEEQEVK